MAAAKIGLVISKKRTGKGAKEELTIAVVNLEKSKEYPLNSICLLPKTINESQKSHSQFVTTFGEKSRQLAIELLSKALKKESDGKVKAQIRERLTLLQPKTKATSKCVQCGCVFEPRRYGRYLQVTCQKCRGK